MGVLRSPRIASWASCGRRIPQRGPHAGVIGACSKTDDACEPDSGRSLVIKWTTQYIRAAVATAGLMPGGAEGSLANVSVSTFLRGRGRCGSQPCCLSASLAIRVGCFNSVSSSVMPLR
jgi:hypothetical protein